MLQVVRQVSLKGSEAVTVVQDSVTHLKHRLHRYSNRKEGTLELFLGGREEGGQLLAAAVRARTNRWLLTGRHRYVLTVEPCVDLSLIHI